MRSRVVRLLVNNRGKACGDGAQYKPLHWYAANGYSKQQVTHTANNCRSYIHNSLACRVDCLQQSINKNMKTDSAQRGLKNQQRRSSRIKGSFNNGATRNNRNDTRTKAGAEGAITKKQLTVPCNRAREECTGSDAR